MDSAPQRPVDILLAAINARYSHSSFGLRCIRANMGKLRKFAVIAEFELKTPARDIADKILKSKCRILGAGIYIWNVQQWRDVLQCVHASPERPVIILGGPEVIAEPETHPLFEWADIVCCGEGEDIFPELCETILAGKAPTSKIIQTTTPDLDTMVLPYEEYGDKDIAHRMIYVETSRGCPFQCEYCLSSIDTKVRYYPMDQVLPAFEQLLKRGVRRFKFVDRTFNLRMDRCLELLYFFRDCGIEDLDLHFEMVPDRLPEALFQAIKELPAGTLHLEVGIQTYNPDVAERIRRTTDYTRVDHNLHRLIHEARARVHADLIAGLPGEDLVSFADGFDRLIAHRPDEIQIGLLKKLRGTTITRHETEWGLLFNEEPPYEILETSSLTASDIQRIKNLSIIWERIGNRQHFPATLALLLKLESSPFMMFLALSDSIVEQKGRRHSIPLREIAEQIFLFVSRRHPEAQEALASRLANDYEKGGKRRDLPQILKTQPRPE